MQKVYYLQLLVMTEVTGD